MASATAVAVLCGIRGPFAFRGFASHFIQRRRLVLRGVACAGIGFSIPFSPITATLSIGLERPRDVHATYLHRARRCLRAYGQRVSLLLFRKVRGQKEVH